MLLFVTLSREEKQVCEEVKVWGKVEEEGKVDWREKVRIGRKTDKCEMGCAWERWRNVGSEEQGGNRLG